MMLLRLLMLMLLPRRYDAIYIDIADFRHAAARRCRLMLRASVAARERLQRDDCLRAILIFICRQRYYC